MKLVHVAVAVIERANGDICIAKRADHQHQGGLWEFPGGKVESDETVTQALAREIHEELGVIVLGHYPLISVRYEYPDKHVLLDVHVVNEFEGEPHGKEGQPVIWCPKDQLASYSFPAANKGILNAILLPPYLAVTNELNQPLIDGWEARFSPKNLMVYLREELNSNNQALVLNLRAQGYRVTVKGADQESGYLHLSSAELLATDDRPDVNWLSASCHNEEEVLKANALNVDFILLSPVNSTPTHPEVLGMGWPRFAELALMAHMPVYALGGIGLDDMGVAKKNGAQGIAGISAFLP